MNPVTMKMIQPIAFKGYDDEDYEEADVSTADTASQEEVKLKRQPEKDVVEKSAEKAPEKPAEKPDISMKERMDGFNKNAEAVATGVNDFSNSAAKTIVGVTGGAVVVGNAAGPAVENLKKAGKAFEPITAGIKKLIKQAGKKGATDAGEQGAKKAAALISGSGIDLSAIAKNAVKKIRSIF